MWLILCFAASQRIAELGMYKSLIVDNHRLLLTFSKHIREELNSTGMSERQLQVIGMRNPEVYSTGKKNYVAYVSKIMLFVMRSRNRLGKL